MQQFLGDELKFLLSQRVEQKVNDPLAQHLGGAIFNLLKIQTESQ